MSSWLAGLSSGCRLWRGTFIHLDSRQFHSTRLVLARQKQKKIPTLSKKQLAAKARRRAFKGKKSMYDNEKMTLEDAIAVLRSVEVASPNSLYELFVKTEMSKGSTIPKGRYQLPREAKAKTKDRILVFAEGKQAEEARNAGADIVGGPELVDGVISGRHKASLFLSTPELIRTITPKLGRVLGPRGLMPSERRGTVTDNIAGYIRNLRSSDEWRGDKAGTIRTPIARAHFPVPDVVKNVRYFMTVVKRATGNIRDPDADRDKKDTNQKPVNAIVRVILSSQQGPGITISDA
ncbi:ribosomal protein L1 [Laetiporus sulphureus 93-53]|uniref:Ribosomal protein n=1 Tax=Laetiporus sulphureus 93-53 TaxID=1314785 RepID=A0A165F991_9APHY|nr:ribosomal protein L1 [Laetiporus sulphureus 93-53]KZT08625.1 ribosomal protein L1 [Laetiporus sulphureus 93-53]